MSMSNSAYCNPQDCELASVTSSISGRNSSFSLVSLHTDLNRIQTQEYSSRSESSGNEERCDVSDDKVKNHEIIVDIPIHMDGTITPSSRLDVELTTITTSQLQNCHGCESLPRTTELSADLTQFPLLELHEENYEFRGVTISSETEDIFSLDTFHAMIQSRLRAATDGESELRPLIIAKVTTRDKLSTQKLNEHYYEGTNLLKVLFKFKNPSNPNANDTTSLNLSTNADNSPSDDENPVLHRYHRYAAILPSNPLTNTPILGEVRFYSLDYSNILSATTANGSQPQAFPLPSATLAQPLLVAESCSPPKYVAKFIGSDYNYAYSPEFRSYFEDATFSTEDSKLLATISKSLLAPESTRHRRTTAAIHTYAANDQTRYSLPYFSSIQSLIPCIGLFLNPNRPIYPVPFSRGSVVGCLLALYFSTSLLTICVNFSEILTTTYDDISDMYSGGRANSLTRFLAKSWYYLLFPFFGFCFDHALTGIYMNRPSFILFAFQLVSYLLAYIVPTLSFVLFSSFTLAFYVRTGAYIIITANCLILSFHGWFYLARRVALA